MKFDKGKILNLLKKEENKSKEPIKVACLIYGQDFNKKWEFLSSGVNSIDFKLPEKIVYCCERIPFIQHAETTAIFKLKDNKKNYSNLVAFVSYMPCYNCVKLLDLINVKKIFYKNELSDGFGFFLFEITKKYCEFKNIELNKL